MLKKIKKRAKERPILTKLQESSKERRKARREAFFGKFAEIAEQSAAERQACLDELGNEHVGLEVLAPDELSESVICAKLCRMIYKHGTDTISNWAMEHGLNFIMCNLTEERPAGRYCTNYAMLSNSQTRTLYIVFRGSQNMKDWVTNFRAIPTLFFGKVNFHRGVLQSMQHQYSSRILPEVLKFLRVTIPGSSEPYSIVCTGHSLGGALATGLYLQWRRDQAELFHTDWKFAPDVTRPAVSLFTFGAPLVIHGEKLDDLQEGLGGVVEHNRMYHFVHNYDLVPRLLGGICISNEAMQKCLIQRFRDRRVSKTVHQFRAVGRYFYFHFPHHSAGRGNATPWSPQGVEMYDATNIISRLLYIPFGLIAARQALADHAMPRYDQVLQFLSAGDDECGTIDGEAVNPATAIVVSASDLCDSDDHDHVAMHSIDDAVPGCSTATGDDAVPGCSTATGEDEVVGKGAGEREEDDEDGEDDLELEDGDEELLSVLALLSNTVTER